MWEHVELREIRVFLALCEELHFGRTADRLQISQTWVSQIVRKLGTQLFDRTSRRVGISAAGRRLRDELVPAYAELAGVPSRAYADDGAIAAMNVPGVWLEPYTVDVRLRGALARYTGALCSELQSTRHAAVR
jgi:DNA-binding transcriptional LysR family regulator